MTVAAASPGDGEEKDPIEAAKRRVQEDAEILKRTHELEREMAEEMADRDAEDTYGGTLGGGVKVKKSPPEDDGVDEEREDLKDDTEKVDRDQFKKYDIIRDSGNAKQWLDSPVYMDQMSRFPDTARPVGPVLQVVDLADPAALEELNMLMAGAQNIHAPLSFVEVVDREWDDKKSNWKMLVKVTKMKYLKILEKD